jgi:hypothetical protein
MRYAALLLLSCAAIAAAGCGKEPTTQAELRLEREDLVTVVHALQAARPSIEREVASTKAAWPHVAHGLPARISVLPRAPIAAAAEDAARIVVPAQLAEARSSTLTGPGASLVGLYRNYLRLAGHGWQMIAFSVGAIERGTPAAARFARANVALYIESVYDAHFTLAQVGKKLRIGYRDLGGAKALGAVLSANEVDALAGAFSEATDRLHPHVVAKLGS